MNSAHTLIHDCHMNRMAIGVILITAISAVLIRATGQTFTDDNWVSIAAPAQSGTTVSATAVDEDGNLYVGGQFTSIGGIEANSIAKWDGGNWSALGSGLSNNSTVIAPIVNAIAISGTNVYVGGEFLGAGGVEAWRLARWDGHQWSEVGTSKLLGSVYSLLADGDDLYVCGGFNDVAGLDGTGLLRWDGQSWHAVGGLKGAIRALTLKDGELYAGGDSLSVGLSNLNNIAKWDGNNWSPLGEGTDDRVTSLAASGTNLYAGGWFVRAGGTAANDYCYHVARWDGVQWNRLRTPAQIGVNGFVYALAVHGNDLYVAGNFGQAGGQLAFYLARWDGANWWPLGSGTDFSINTLSISRNNLFAGGLFGHAGGKASGRVARAFLGAVPPLEVSISDGRATIFFRDLLDGDYLIQRITPLEETGMWETLATRTAEAGGIDFVDNNAPPFEAYYRTVPVPN